MHILVTGGLGFIGSHFVDRLLEGGHRVTVADSLLLGRREHVAHHQGRNGFAFEEMDVADQRALNALFARADFGAVVHLAANSDIARSHADPATDFDNTLRTTWSVLEAMRLHAVSQLVFASTSAVYGEAQGAIAEDHGPLLPISHYGAAKLASEAFISSYGQNYGIQSWIPRFPNVVGERLTHGAIFDFAAKLRRTPDRLEVLGNGEQIKPYLHVADLIDAVMLAWSRFDGQTNVFNVGGTTRCSVRRMAEIVLEESGLDADIAFTGGDRGWIGDVPAVDYNTDKIRSLGWEPKMDSEQAIRTAARWAFGASS